MYTQTCILEVVSLRHQWQSVVAAHWAEILCIPVFVHSMLTSCWLAVCTLTPIELQIVVGRCASICAADAECTHFKAAYVQLGPRCYIHLYFGALTFAVPVDLHMLHVYRWWYIVHCNITPHHFCLLSSLAHAPRKTEQQIAAAHKHQERRFLRGWRGSLNFHCLAICAEPIYYALPLSFAVLMLLLRTAPLL